MIDTVVHRFVEAREGIKRQAVAAHDAGSSHTQLELHLSYEAAEAGEAYLAALDEVDAYCRAMRLLTLETPPEQRVFRRWYVEELVRQVRAAAAGEEPGEPMTFEQRLLQEIASVASADRRSDRAVRLYTVSVALAAAASVEDVSTVVLNEGVDALSASGAGVLLVDDAHQLTVTGTVGYDDELVDRLRHESADAELPAAHALRTGQAVWLESPAELHARFPTLHGIEATTVSMCAVPLEMGGSLVGALRFSFDRARLFDEDERRFVLALAAQCAQALHRTRLEQKTKEDSFRVAVDTMIDPVMMCRPERDSSGGIVDLRLEYVNAAGLDPRQQPIGRLLSELWPGVQAQGLLQQYLDVAVTGEPLVLDAYRFDDSESQASGARVYDLRATRIGDLVFIVYRNVTQRVEREQEALRHREALAEAQRIANVGSWLRDTETETVQWSDQFFEICGLDPATVRPSREVFRDLLGPKGRVEFEAAVLNAATEGARFQLEQRLTRPDGDVRDVVITGEATADATGRVTITRGTVQDVTDQRFVELALQRSQERLREEHRTVQILQSAILPTALPDIPGASIAARYLPASERTGVGGDFYDAFPLADGRVLLTVGDVAGKGVGAAEAVGQLRNSLRMAAIIDPSPAVIVQRLNQLIERGFSAPFATAVIGIYSPDDGRFDWASAGHLPLVLRDTAGGVRLLEEKPTHPPLGVAPYHLRPLHSVVLERGEMLLLYTDGLVERRGEAIDVGFQRLVDIVRAAANGPGAMTAAILDAATVADGNRRDDICLLLLTRH
ncbi:MAG: Serine phosphatase RsbU, regulator of sigma subunit [uncultured Acidimicrobiales bacterium]|uniref:Serine phosphatase RsbU, regulator of sigma subunit n=1 Tax=uncultured Acidimicrobiales bacterium TaxID=310071 RepID=A0A6J4I562_9ACTN|nr:MAG: Serine phosphatase RsbU, regulator of sigma subunit [uncultured Acidimicrobiales bacterium]